MDHQDGLKSNPPDAQVVNYDDFQFSPDSQYVVYPEEPLTSIHT